MSLSDLREALEKRQVGHTLPGPFYSDPSYFAADLTQVWYREWLFVGHTGETPHVGDYRAFAVGNYQLMAIRGSDNTVRVLHNVCRHRGSLVCTEASGTATRRLVCPYHQWSYELDGSLGKARRTSLTLETTAYSLGPVHCEIAAGMMFINLAESPPDFAPVRNLVDGYLAPFDLETAKVIAVDTVVEHGNWKLVMENNRECFHCRGAHAELCVSFPEAPLHTGAAAGADLLRLESMVEQCEALGLPSRFVAADDFQYRLMRMPLNEGTRSMTVDGLPGVNQRFGSLPDDDIGDVLFYHYPSTWNHFMADHSVTFRVMPLTPTTTQLTTTWLVPGHATEGADYDVETLTSVWRLTNAEDAVLVENTQRGTLSPAYRPGPYSTAEEEGVIQFIEWYAAAMLADSGAGQRCGGQVGILSEDHVTWGVQTPTEHAIGNRGRLWFKRAKQLCPRHTRQRQSSCRDSDRYSRGEHDDGWGR
ncbi:MAG: aromatic ring-hydroxylating dioxygenase subunit alpha [Acidimicrobiales bacterium]